MKESKADLAASMLCEGLLQHVPACTPFLLENGNGGPGQPTQALLLPVYNSQQKDMASHQSKNAHTM